MDILITAFNRIGYDYNDFGDNSLYSPEEDIYLFDIKELVLQIYEDPKADDQETCYRLSIRIPIEDRVIICHNYLTSRDECKKIKYDLQAQIKYCKGDLITIACGSVIIKKIKDAKIEL